MSDLMQTFVSNNHNEFTWPYPVPLVAVPSAPPKNTGKRLYLPRSDPDECECDFHGYDNDMKRYKALMKQEGNLCENIRKVNHEMTGLLSNMLESPCKSDDETMKTVYQTAYERRDAPITKYRPMMADIDSPVRSPIPSETIGLYDAHRDPLRFRYSPFEIPTIDPPRPVDLTRVPDTFVMWSKPFTGRSEYMDGISKMGLSNMKNQQQYLQPLPSSRRRWGDCDI